MWEGNVDELKRKLRRLGMDVATLAPLTEEGMSGIYTLTVPGAGAIAQWRRLREVVPQMGYWPVLLGGEQDLKMHREMLGDADERTPGEIIQQGVALNPHDWLAKQAEKWNDEAEEFSLDEYHGEWPGGNHASTQFQTPNHYPGKRKSVLNLFGKQKPELYLGLVPASQGWEVPAPLRLGGWNDCPPPEVHVSFMRYWHDSYGAELVAATHDVVEMQVARPPTTREGALSLAMEQFFYCGDVVTQGTETLERLAATLLKGTVWFFWWD